MINSEEIQFAANHIAPANCCSLATSPKAFRQCAACANDHSFRFLQAIGIRIFDSSIILQLKNRRSMPRLNFNQASDCN